MDKALSDIKKTIQAVKKGHWRLARTIMEEITWKPISFADEYEVKRLISSFLALITNHAIGWTPQNSDLDSEDYEKNEKLAMKTLEMLESEFKRFHREKNRYGTIASELLKVAKSLVAVNERKALEGYLEAALWAEVDEDDNPLDDNYSIVDIESGSIRDAKNDINKFIKAAGDLLDLDGARCSRIGHDLWLTRNGHGAGFWDGDYPEAGDDLTKIAERMGGKHIFVGDDNKVWID